MKIHLPKFFYPPVPSDYKQAQKAKLLHYLLLAIFCGSVLAGIGNYLTGWITKSVFLTIFASICLIGFLLNHLGYYRVAATILCGAFFVVLGLSMYYGDGLHDGSIIAYPIFILCVTSLFGTPRSVWIATLLSIFSLIAIYWLQATGGFVSDFPASLNRLVTIAFLYVCTGVITWVVHDTYENNLKSLTESYDLTLQEWAKALEARDWETAGHSQRVVNLTTAIARELGIEEDEIIQIQRGAILHDIGKMAIPDSILLKPGPLNDSEMKIMQEHPRKAVDMISKSPYLHPAISIPRSHHERWDGTGYPDGLAGQEIPLAARIFTVVDQWDALTSDRPFRKAWPREKVIAFIKEYSGKIFDPEIANVFLSMV
jgi:putative nucleotidyltransferase with HDIG domain